MLPVNTGVPAQEPPAKTCNEYPLALATVDQVRFTVKLALADPHAGAIGDGAGKDWQVPVPEAVMVLLPLVLSEDTVTVPP